MRLACFAEGTQQVEGIIRPVVNHPDPFGLDAQPLLPPRVMRADG